MWLSLRPCLPGASGSELACCLWVVTGSRWELQQPSKRDTGATLPRAGRGWGLQGSGPGGGDRQGRGPLPGPGWVGQRPPGPGCEARPSVAATINMFVQGKPGWGLCALAWPGRKGCLCLAHWGDCSRSRNCCPVAGKVRRPLGPVGSERCLRPLCLLPAVRLSVHITSGPWHGDRRCQARAEGKRSQESSRLARAVPVPGQGGASGTRASPGQFVPWPSRAALTTVFRYWGMPGGGQRESEVGKASRPPP